MPSYAPQCVVYGALVSVATLVSLQYDAPAGAASARTTMAAAHPTPWCVFLMTGECRDRTSGASPSPCVGSLSGFGSRKYSLYSSPRRLRIVNRCAAPLDPLMTTTPEEAPEVPVRGPIASEDIPWQGWDHGGRFAGRSRHLTRSFGAYRVGVLVEELSPGKQSCQAHYHLLEEEHVLILEGTVTLRLGDERLPMKAGDYVCFPAGQKVGHCLVNEGDAVCRYLVIGERNPNEVCVYTDSNKVMVRALGELYDKAATRRYFDGEDTGPAVVG